MILRGFIKKGAYFDSVSLMIVSKEINKIEGIIDSAVIMGTKENKSILNAAGLLINKFREAGDTDLLIVIKAEAENVVNKTFKKVDDLLEEMRNPVDKVTDFLPKSFEGALKFLSGANLSLISVAGKYAAHEARKALENGLHVMIFSDNVSIEDEIKLKKYAQKKNLLVMGPDCGTAIINGIPLAFANVVNRGDIGIVAASGTGLQEVSSIISNEGKGLSQAIGTGGRDVTKKVGGIMFISALRALAEDKNTKIIILVSKPPHEEILKDIAKEIKKINKPIVTLFIGIEPEILKNTGAINTRTLEQAALIAVSLSKGEDYETILKTLEKRKEHIKKIALTEAERKIDKQKYVRGLFSGGTLCDEAQLIFIGLIGDVYSNTPLNPEFKLKDSWKSFKNSVIDLGEDEFTVGRPHPMIDFSLRNKRILEEAKNPEVAVILLDIVLGFGANMEPAEELIPIIRKAKELSPNLSIICSITGTDKDPQNRENVHHTLEKTGVIVMPSNAAASELAGKIIKHLGGN